MQEFWESAFMAKQEMWGKDPAESALFASELFAQHQFRKILIPGFGYGRNAAVFCDRGMQVTGIEISATAIDLARKNMGNDIRIYHGAVREMPYDHDLYDGIFCYALIHLLNWMERKKLIRDCYNQLRPGGLMVFVAISVHTPSFGEGRKLSHNRFQTIHGVNLYYYDQESINKEFEEYGLLESTEICEPSVSTGNRPPQRFFRIICQK